jgi:hypothetical protein
VRQVHYACWPTEVTPRNAQRYLAQLLAVKQVTWKQGPDGSRVYALTSLGARRLRAELGIETTYDSDFARRHMPSYHHRCLANEVGLWWSQLHGERAGYYTEHEVSTGRAPITAGPKYLTDPLGKVPDGLLTLSVTPDESNPYSTWLGWVEVEYSDKPSYAHEHMVRALCDILGFGKEVWEVGANSAVTLAVVVCPHTSQEDKLAGGVLRFLSRNRQNYNVLAIVRSLYIWRPGADEGVALLEWIERRPTYLALRDKYRLWWPALPKT